MADLYRDFVFTRNTVPVTDLDTQIQVEDVSVFPSNAVLKKGEFYVAFDSTLTYPHSFEIVRLVSIDTATKTLTVVRGQAGTTAVGHAIVTYIKGTLNSDQVRRARAGMSGTQAPAPDQTVFLQGDRFYHASEGRFYVFSGNAAFLRDSFTRAASTTTMGSTEVQTVLGEANGVLAPQVSQVVPYVAPWVPNDTSIFGINADGRAYLVSGVTGANTMVNVGSTDFDITFDVFMSTTAGSDYGIFFRVDTESKYGYYLQFLGTTASLYRMVNGAFAAIPSQTTTYGTNATRNWRVWVEGNVIRILRDGTQVINYTETTTGFLVGGETYRPEGHVGIRYGNTAATTDAAIVWDNFTCTHPGNTGLNIPKPQGWTPAASQTGQNDTSAYLLKQAQKVATDLSVLVNYTDDLHQAVIGLEQSQGTQSSDIATIATALDDWLETYKAQPSVDQVATALGHVAVQVDEVQEVVSNLHTTGVIRSTTADSFASYGEFILADASGYPTVRPAVVTGQDFFASSIAATPSTINFTNTAPVLVVSVRGTWTYYASTASLDGVAQTERTRFDGGSAQMRLFTSLEDVGAAAHTMTFTGGGGADIYFALAVGLSGVSLTGASYVSTTGSSITIPSGTDQMLVIAAQSNAGAFTMTGAGGLTWTKVFEAPSGNSNRAAMWVAKNTTGASSVTVTLSASGLNGIVAGSFPAVSSDAGIYSNIFLPAPRANTSIRVQNVDANNPIRVKGAFQNGNGTQVLGSQYAVGTYISNGSVWIPQGSSTSAGVVVTANATYSAKVSEVVLANAMTGAFTVTLPSPVKDGQVTVKKTDTSGNPVTVAAVSGLVDGQATALLSSAYEALAFISDGTNWWVF